MDKKQELLDAIRTIVSEEIANFKMTSQNESEDDETGNDTGNDNEDKKEDEDDNDYSSVYDF